MLSGRPRVALTNELIWQRSADEMHWMVNVDSKVLIMLADVAEVYLVVLRSRYIHAAHYALHF